MTLWRYMSSQFSVWQNADFFIRLIVSCMCGAAIGFERSKRFKGAGLRTHIIVCLGAAMMMIVSKYAFVDQTSPEGIFFNGVRGADSARIAAQVVSGVSFLGAGVIFKHGSTIRGLTTAAGVWVTAGIGLAIGAGMYPIGIFSTILIMLVQFSMHRHIFLGENLFTTKIQFSIVPDQGFEKALDTFLETHHMQILENKITYGDANELTYALMVRSPTEISTNDIHLFLRSVSAVHSIDCTACL